MTKKENAVVVTQHLISHYKIRVTNETIEETIMSHPDYPSLKSICDSLKEWDIKHYPVRLGMEELKEAESPFIAHLNEGGGNLVFVPKLNGEAKVTYFYSRGKSKTISEKEFLKLYSGVSLLLDPDSNSGETDYKEKRQNANFEHFLPWLGLLSISILVFYSTLQIDYQQINASYFIFLFTKTGGVFFSTLLVLKDLNFNSRLADNLCGVSKKTNCNSILNTSAAKVIGWLHWSDIGLIYFLSGVLVLITFPSSGMYSLLSLLSFGVLAYVVYSIYYQAYVAKTWCRLCLIIQFILILEAFLFIFYTEQFAVSWISLLQYAAIGVTLLFGVMIYKMYLLSKKTLQKTKIGFLKFKKNPQVFISLLKNGDLTSLNIDKTSFVIGESNASIEVVAFLSLNCNPCKRAFNQLKNLFFQESFKVHLIFSLHDNDKAFVTQLTRSFDEQRLGDAIKLLDDWYNGDTKKRKGLVAEAEKHRTNVEFSKLQSSHRELFTSAGVKGTPTFFINEYQLPKEYQISDITGYTDVFE